MSKYKQTETWSVDDLMKLAESKGISALYGIVNPTQILYVDKTQLSKLFRLEKKETSISMEAIIMINTIKF